MHIGSRVERLEKSAAWLQVGVAFGELANEWSGRRDLVVYVGEDGGQNIAPAFFDPQRGEIEVNATKAFGDTVNPALIGDLRDRRELSEWSRAGGLLLHEAMHAKYSTADWEDLYEEAEARFGKARGRAVMEIYKLLEEPRIESRGVRDWPRDKAYLRTSALWIVEQSLESLGAVDDDGNPLPIELDLPSVALLLLGRVDAGVLKKTDVRKLRKLVEDQWGKTLLEQIRVLWKEFQFLNDTNYKQLGRMLEISKTVLDMLPEPPSQAKKAEEEANAEDGKGQQGGQGGSGSGQGQGQGDGSEEDGDGQGGGSGEMSDAEKAAREALGKALADALADAQDKAQHGGAREAQDEAEQIESEKRQAERNENMKRREENRKEAENTFGENQQGSRSNGYDYGMERGASRSRVDRRRDASGAEVSAAGKLAKSLAKAKYRDREARRIRQDLPPGRLHGGASMRVEAARAQGQTGTGFDPFRRTKRTHVDDPRLAVGIMCDISGSMGGTMEPMAVATWTVAEAVRRLPDATAASVYFGAGIFPTLKPGERLKQVTIYTAPDGGHQFDAAFRSLDGGLDLLDGRGARLLVVCSDGIFEDFQVQAVKKWLQECRKNGVGVVWLGLKDGYAADYCKQAGSGVEYVDISSGTVTDAASVIGRAMEKALTAAGAGR